MSRRTHPITDVPPYAGRRRRTPSPAAPVVIDEGHGELAAPVVPRPMAPAGPVLRARLDGTPLEVAAPTEAAPTTTPTATPTTTPSKGAAPGPTPTPIQALDPRASRPVPTGPPGRLIEIERVGPDIGLLRIGKPTGLTFIAGQYLRVGLSNVRQAKFTIASAPHDPYLEVCVEAIPGGRLTPRLLALGPGAVLDVENTAKGSFVLDPAGSVHLMIATGTGIAPFRSMVRDALHRDLPGTFVVLHGASFVDHLPYRDELTALAAADARLTYVPTVSRPDDPRNRGWTGATGRVDALAVEMLPTVAGPATRAYACGLGAMVSAVTSALKANGLKVSSETFD